MYKIDEILNMLDYKKSGATQQKGRELAQDVKSIDVFVQPLSFKNAWENCAKILSAKPDKILTSYLYECIKWIDDLNCSGARLIFERLKVFSDTERLVFWLRYCIKRAVATKEQNWLENMTALVEQANLKEEVNKIIPESPQDYDYDEIIDQEIVNKNIDEYFNKRIDEFSYGATTFKIVRQEIERICHRESQDEDVLHIFVPEATSNAEIYDYVFEQSGFSQSELFRGISQYRGGIENRVHMCDIDEIMDMLDWSNGEEIMQKGIKLAGDIKCIDAFMDPKQASVSARECCAAVLAQRSDRELIPYLIGLIEWLEDYNWPGAVVIFKRLIEFKEVEMLVSSVKYCVEWALGTENRIWLTNIAELLDNNNLKAEIPSDILTVLQNSRSQYHILDWV